METFEKESCFNIDFDEMERLKKILGSIHDDEELNCKADLMKALSDPTRLQILYLLKCRDLCICEIMAVLDKPQSTISHHLNVLKNADFIKGFKEGIWTKYSLQNQEIMVGSFGYHK